MSMVMKFGSTHYGTLHEQFCDIESQWEKVRSIVGRGHTDHDLGSCEGFTYCVLSHMRFFGGYHISFCYFFVLKLMRGHDFWVQFELCW